MGQGPHNYHNRCWYPCFLLWVITGWEKAAVMWPKTYVVIIISPSRNSPDFPWQETLQRLLYCTVLSTTVLMMFDQLSRSRSCKEPHHFPCYSPSRIKLRILHNINHTNAGSIYHVVLCIFYWTKNHGNRVHWFLLLLLLHWKIINIMKQMM
jgi:hypothetical protein